MFHHIGIPFVFTLEASFAGANRGALAGKHFSLGNLTDVGKGVLRGIWSYKKTLLTGSIAKLKDLNLEAEAKFTKERDISDGSSSEEEPIPPKRKGGKPLLKQMQSEVLKDDKEEKKNNLINRANVTPIRN